MKLRDWMYFNEVSIPEMATHLGIVYSTLINILDGKSQPRIDLAMKIEDYTKDARGIPQVTMREFYSPRKGPKRGYKKGPKKKEIESNEQNDIKHSNEASSVNTPVEKLNQLDICSNIPHIRYPIWL